MAPSYEEVEATGRAVLGPDDVLPGVPSLVGDPPLEVLMDDGVRLVVLSDPIVRTGAVDDISADRSNSDGPAR